MPLFRRYNASLEDHFVVVNWDQRGLVGLSTQRRWVREFGGAARGPGNLTALIMFGWPILTCPEFRLRDKFRYLSAEVTSMEALEDDLLAGDLTSKVRELAVPLSVFQWRCDQ